jgi:hypothetical protein
MFDYGSLKSKFNFTHLPATSNTINIGDDIQVECASRLWGVRNYVERDDFSTWKSGMNIPFFGWYGYDLSLNLPKANCVLVSFHLCNSMMNCIAKNQKFKDWLKFTIHQQGFPAITRDIATRNFLRCIQIESEFGGCVTQTLEPYSGYREDTISIDAPSDIASNCDVQYTQNNYDLLKMCYTDRLKLAAERIDVLAKAKHVHTNRIHVYLPCKALGTPVTFYKQNLFEPHRLTGLIP